MTDGSSPLVSIVVPVYNGERFLGDALESIRNQSFTDWETIIVDDCSTDSTPDIASSFEQADKRFRHYRNETNKKLPASLNEGFRHARGIYHTWTSDDNMFRPEALSIMVESLEADTGADLVYCNVQRVDEEGHPLTFPKAPLTPSLIHVYNVVQACFLYKADITERLNGYDEELFLVEDYDFWLRAKRYFKFKHINRIMYDYRIHNSALTSTKQKSIREKTHIILSRELRSKDTSLAQRFMLAMGLAFNKVRILTIK